jgi:hypothetical protein
MPIFRNFPFCIQINLDKLHKYGLFMLYYGLLTILYTNLGFQNHGKRSAEFPESSRSHLPEAPLIISGRQDRPW